jgi:tetratricopeptide (TPR) repeat protein
VLVVLFRGSLFWRVQGTCKVEETKSILVQPVARLVQAPQEWERRPIPLTPKLISVRSNTGRTPKRRTALRFKITVFATLVVMLTANFAAGQGSRLDPAESIKRGNAKYSNAEYLAAIGEYGQVPPHAGETYSQAVYNIGVCYYELWRTEDAIEMYKKAVAVRSGRYPKALFAMGVALEDLHRQVEAKEAYRQATTVATGREAREAHFRLGLLLAAESDLEGAAAHFTEAIAGKITPGSHNNLGVVLALKGRLREAEREFEVALRQSGGTFADATHNLNLCRSLIRASAQDSFASLRLVPTTDALSK